MFIKSVYIEQSALAQSGSYVKQIPAIASMEPLSLKAPVTFFVGENGTGKSTLLEAIAVAFGFNPEGGSKNYSFSSRDTHSALCDFIKLIKTVRHATDGFFLRAESYYNTSTEMERLDAISLYGVDTSHAFLEDNYGGKSPHEQSHGESFLSLIHNRFWGNGVYILDEPEAALSPSRQLTLLAELHRLIGEKSQFIIATHSPILLAYPDAQIFSFDHQRLTPVRYKDTEHYQVTKNFLDCPERMLDILLTEEST